MHKILSFSVILHDSATVTTKYTQTTVFRKQKALFRIHSLNYFLFIISFIVKQNGSAAVWWLHGVLDIQILCLGFFFKGGWRGICSKTVKPMMSYYIKKVFVVVVLFVVFCCCCCLFVFLSQQKLKLLKNMEWSMVRILISLAFRVILLLCWVNFIPLSLNIILHIYADFRMKNRNKRGCSKFARLTNKSLSAEPLFLLSLCPLSVLSIRDCKLEMP